MNLYAVTINHPTRGQRTITLAGADADTVRAEATAAGLEVHLVEPAAPVEPVEPAAPVESAAPVEPAAPAGRLYGRSAQGPRRNATEMAQDRRIEELAKDLGVDLTAERVADDLEAELLAAKEATE